MTDPNFYIETPRLFLSYLQAEDDAHCDFLVALYNSPEFITSIGGEPTPIVTREAARKTLAGRFRAEHARNGYGTYLVSLKPTSTEFSQGVQKEDKLAALRSSTPIGTVGIMKGEPPDCFDAPDIGFAILPAYMRKGYTKEAALAAMDYVAREKGVTDIFGFCAPGNGPSRAVLASLGFEYRGDRPLRVFGDMVSAVWTRPGMKEDLAAYGL